MKKYNSEYDRRFNENSLVKSADRLMEYWYWLSIAAIIIGAICLIT